MKTAAKLKEEGFTEISTVECLLREMQVRKMSQTVFDPLRQPTQRHHNNDNDHNNDDGDRLEAKKLKVDDDANAESGAADPEPEVSGAKDATEKSFVTAIPLLKMPGHTGFLTFATLPPNLNAAN
jgi:hypothetical protein